MNSPTLKTGGHKVQAHTQAPRGSESSYGHVRLGCAPTRSQVYVEMGTRPTHPRVKVKEKLLGGLEHLDYFSIYLEMTFIFLKGVGIAV